MPGKKDAGKEKDDKPDRDRARAKDGERKERDKRSAERPDKPARKPTPAFPKKAQQPTPAAFAARLPLSLGKRFDLIRNYLIAQKGVTEDVFFYGPETGWALRYRRGSRPLCSLHIYDERPIGIVSLEPPAIAGIDWKGLSPAGRTARKQAHGSPSLLWLDVELEGTGAADFKAILRAKLASVPATAASSDAGATDLED